jgi:hypothetical protein
MANTSIDKFDEYLLDVLQYQGNTGSVNLYMAFGGTNFGWTAGACVQASASPRPRMRCRHATLACMVLHGHLRCTAPSSLLPDKAKHVCMQESCMLV